MNGYSSLMWPSYRNRVNLINSLTLDVDLNDAGEDIKLLWEYLTTPPDWWVKQAQLCIDEGSTERLLRPLASATAYECLNDPRKMNKAYPLVEARVKVLA